MDREIINKSIDYILEHLDAELTVGAVASRFYFSESYFARCFREATGESVYAFVKRLKMDLSAVDIKLDAQRPITQIGLEYGYSASNFATAFKKHHGVAPVLFRRAANVREMVNPFYPDGRSAFASFEACDEAIRIAHLPDQTVIYERIVGNYIDLKEKWPRFVAKHRDKIDENTVYIERFYDDPAITNRDACVFDLCMPVPAQNASADTTVIPGGAFALFRYEGRIRDIFCAVQGVFDVWLPRSGYRMSRRYALNIYPSIDEKSDEVTMDLCIPVEKGGNSEAITRSPVR